MILPMMNQEWRSIVLQSYHPPKCSISQAESDWNSVTDQFFRGGVSRDTIRHGPRTDILSVLGQEIGDLILEAYRITDRSTEAQLITSLTLLQTDIIFGWPEECTHRRLLSDFDSSIASRPITARRYRIRYGNPFGEATTHGRGFHAIESIHLIDAFQDDLLKQDEEERYSPTEGEKSMRATNAQLCESMQRIWIGFINGQAQDMHNDDSIVFCRDRTTKVLNMTTDPEWIDTKKRLDLIAGHYVAASRLCYKLLEMSGIPCGPLGEKTAEGIIRNKVFPEMMVVKKKNRL